MPGRKVSPKTVAAASEAAAKQTPATASTKKSPALEVSPCSKLKPAKQVTTAPKKEVEYVVYKVGAEKPKAPVVHKKKPDLSMMNTSLKDSAVAKSKRGKNVKTLAPKKKEPTLPHHHGGKPPAKKLTVEHAAE